MVPDCLIETWQADPEGRFADLHGHGGVSRHEGFRGFARGMLNRCVTRIYFADEVDANAADPVLASVPADRLPTLLAVAVADGYRFDIHLQGAGETVFFAL